jgi:hypothetical protein
VPEDATASLPPTRYPTVPQTWRRRTGFEHKRSFASATSSSSNSTRSTRMSLRSFASWASRTPSMSSYTPSLATLDSSGKNTPKTQGEATPALKRVLDGEYSTKITMALVTLKLYGWLQRKAGWYENEPPVQVYLNSKLVAPKDLPLHLQTKYGYVRDADSSQKVSHRLIYTGALRCIEKHNKRCT